MPSGIGNDLHRPADSGKLAVPDPQQGLGEKSRQIGFLRHPRLGAAQLLRRRQISLLDHARAEQPGLARNDTVEMMLVKALFEDQQPVSVKPLPQNTLQRRRADDLIHIR
ncbi:hypothetical protein QW131_13205 [Roseibium salinum]|nr:hypothetical protein [Roseibium salinum]